MTYRLEDIVFVKDAYWVLRVKSGFEVYRTGVTHSTRCAQICHLGDEGMRRVREEIDRRVARDAVGPDSVDPITRANLLRSRIKNAIGNSDLFDAYSDDIANSHGWDAEEQSMQERWKPG